MRTLAHDPEPTTTTITTSRPVCSPMPTQVTQVGPRSLTFVRPTSTACPVTGQVTVTVYGKQADAEARKRPVGTATGNPGESLVVGGLKPNKNYWYVTTDANYVRGPVRTLKPNVTTPPAPACTATYKVLNAWQDGFVAEVIVAAARPMELKSWTLTWQLRADEDIARAWGANLSVRVEGPTGAPTTTGGATSPSSAGTSPTPRARTVTVHNLPSNGWIATGDAASFALLGSTRNGAAPVPPAITCTATS